MPRLNVSGNVVEVRGLDELRARFSEYPEVFDQVMQELTKAQLLTLQENIPPYPPKPATSTYVRTGTLGRSLGSSPSGGAGGKADVFETLKGENFYEARLGSNLFYAGPVIGNPQASFFAQYWWRLIQVIGRAFQPLLEMAEGAAQQMADFLKGKGL